MGFSDLVVRAGGGEAPGKWGGAAASKSKGAIKAKGAKVKGKTSTGWEWQAQIPYVLQAMHKALRMRTDRAWTTTQERDALVG